MFHHGFDLIGGFLFPIVISTAWTMFATMRFLGRGHNDND